MIVSNPNAEEKAQYKTYLADAEAAYHRLQTGAQETSISYNGESVSYSQASMPKLLAYITSLRKALGKSLPSNRGVAFKSVAFGSRSRRGF